MTSISVVIPCYKYGQYLEQAVSSVLDEQRGVDVRVLIIDDASPDDSADVARKLEARDPRIEVIVHDTNQGNIATFNEGLLKWADGDYCALVSADDQLTPGALQRARDFLDTHRNVGFVYGHALWFMDGVTLPAPRIKVQGSSVRSGHEWLTCIFRQGENPITSPEVVMRTSVLRRVGGFDPRLPHAADMELWMRLATNADVGFIRGVDQAYYRLHPANMRKGYGRLADLRERRSVFETILDRYGDSLENSSSLWESARRQLAKQAVWEAGIAYGWRHHPGRTTAMGLIDFAVDCWPDVAKLPLYRTVEAGNRVGPREASFMFSQKARWWLRRRGWRYRGV